MSALSAFKRILPVANRVLVKRVEPQTKTAGGILLQNAEDKQAYGEVVEVGQGHYDSAGKLVPLSVKKGDFVLLPEYGSVKVKLADIEYHLYRDTEILGVLKKD